MKWKKHPVLGRKALFIDDRCIGTVHIGVGGLWTARSLEPPCTHPNGDLLGHYNTEAEARGVLEGRAKERA